MVAALFDGDRALVDQVRDKTRTNQKREWVEKLVDLKEVSVQ